MKPAPRRLLCGKSASVGCDTGHEELSRSRVGQEQANQPGFHFCSVFPYHRRFSRFPTGSSLAIYRFLIFDNSASILRIKLAPNHHRKYRELASRTLGWSDAKQSADVPSGFHITNRRGAVMMRAFGTQPPRTGGSVRPSWSLGLEMLWRIAGNGRIDVIALPAGHLQRLATMGSGCQLGTAIDVTNGTCTAI